jgi:hypothetical protein
MNGNRSQNNEPNLTIAFRAFLLAVFLLACQSKDQKREKTRDGGASEAPGPGARDKSGSSNPVDNSKEQAGSLYPPSATIFFLWFPRECLEPMESSVGTIAGRMLLKIPLPMTLDFCLLWQMI